MKQYEIGAVIGGLLATIGAAGAAYFVKLEHREELAAIMQRETTFHGTTVAECERAAELALKAIAVYDYNKSGLEAIKRVYELSASEPVAVRQGAARVTSMVEMYHQATGNHTPNRQILEEFSKEFKLACQKRPLK